MADDLKSLTNAQLEQLSHDLNAQIEGIRDQKLKVRKVLDARSLNRRKSIWEAAPDGVGGGFTGTYEKQWYDDRDEDTEVVSTSVAPTVVDAEAATAGGGS